MISRLAFELCMILFFIFIAKQSSYVESLPSKILDDDQQQSEQQAESISENFFDEVRQLLEQKLASETVSVDDLDSTTTEEPIIVDSDEHIVESTISSSSAEGQLKSHLPRELEILFVV